MRGDAVIVEFIGLFLAGLLVEFVVRYGVQLALRRLEDRAHLLARIALVHRMRFVVPALIVPHGRRCRRYSRPRRQRHGLLVPLGGPRGTDRLPGNCVRGNRDNIRVIEWDADNRPRTGRP